MTVREAYIHIIKLANEVEEASNTVWNRACTREEHELVLKLQELGNRLHAVVQRPL